MPTAVLLQQSSCSLAYLYGLPLRVLQRLLVIHGCRRRKWNAEQRMSELGEHGEEFIIGPAYLHLQGINEPHPGRQVLNVCQEQNNNRSMKQNQTVAAVCKLVISSFPHDWNMGCNLGRVTRYGIFLSHHAQQWRKTHVFGTPRSTLLSTRERDH